MCSETRIRGTFASFGGNTDSEREWFASLQLYMHAKESTMKSRQLASVTLAALIAASFAITAQTAHAGVLWVDTAYESINIPLDSPGLGTARAKYYLERQNLPRAEAALKKVIAKYPTAAEAHRLLAAIYRDAGKAELATAHEEIARALT
jgi:tetratricopeptide (TPR) repeat protein